VPISAPDVVTLAFQHTKRQLFQPFRFGQWVRLAFVGLLAGELGSGGNFNFSKQFNAPASSGRPSLGQLWGKIDPAILATVITVLIISGLVLFLVMTYISSVMRFILFDSVVKKECRIREGWSRRQDPGLNYFLWQLGLMFVTFFAAIILIGLPAAFAFGMGWFNPPRAHILQLVLLGFVVFVVFVLFLIAIAVVHVMTKDFVVPQMALEGVGAIEGWRRLWPMLQREMKGYAGYIGMKIVLAIVAAIAVSIVTIILAVIIAVPFVATIVAAVLAGKTAGLTWNVFTITAAVVAGCILFVIFFFLVSMISVPLIVFFPAYSIYFFAARYRPLGLVMYPAPPQSSVAVPGSPPPFTPPPLPAV
jgi:hypothetical protein